MHRPDERFPPADDATKALSKTRRKAEMDALQALGEKLVGLAPERLAELELPETLTEALAAARRITQREARRRQLQFIGRLMREVDPEPIRARVAQWADAPNAQKARASAVERWRERLLEDRDALETLCAQRPSADRERLAALIDGARIERSRGGPPRAYRELYRLLDRLFSAGSKP